MGCCFFMKYWFYFTKKQLTTRENKIHNHKIYNHTHSTQ